MTYVGAIHTVPQLMGPGCPGAQPFASFPASGTQAAAFTAGFGEEAYLNATAGGFVVTLPALTALSKGSRTKLIMRGNPLVGGATPQNVTITPDVANGIGGAPVGTSILLSGHSTIELESDGGTDWIITIVPSVPSTLATFTDGNQTLTRQGPITRVTANATTAAGRTFTFSNTGAVSGDIFIVSIPTHGANTIAIASAASVTLATFAATVAGGAWFIFDGSVWSVMTAGGSTT